MTWYYQNNKDVFKVNLVDLPKDLIRDYRLTLDYEKDLFMFNSLIDKLKKENMDINLVNIFKVLDGNPEIPKINNYIKNGRNIVLNAYIVHSLSRSRLQPEFSPLK